jgi:riboflavin synthase
VTTLGSMPAGRSVNLERPLRADARLGGHFVLGHVDAVGTLISDRADGEHRWIEVSYPPALAPFLISKGSIAVDGISLTVNRVADMAAACEFSVNLIPHTVAHTTLRGLEVGRRVNLEVDLIARYVERMLGGTAAPA